MLNLRSFCNSAIYGAIFLIFFFFIFAPKSFAQVVINEFYTPTTDNDWVELYNTSDNSIDISGWFLKDNTSTIGTIKNATISGKKFLVIEVGKRLNQDKDEVYLFDNSEKEKDSWSYNTEVNNDTSFGRKPDGDSWHRLSPPTKGTSNDSSSIVDPSPSPTPTPTPTHSPTPTPSPTISPTASAKPSTTPKTTPKKQTAKEDKEDEKDEETDFSGEVLGATESSQPQEAEEKSEENKKEGKKISILPLIIIGSGILFLLAGSFPFIKSFIKNIKNRKKNYLT